MTETLGNNPGLVILLLLVGFGVVGYINWQRIKKDWALFKQWKAAGMPMPSVAPAAVLQTTPAASSSPPAFDPAPLPGAGKALRQAPGDLRYALAYMREHYGDDQFNIPLGWYADKSGPQCGVASLVDDVYHILLTAQSRIGKDVEAANILFALTSQYTPQQLQVCLIDGKGLDWAAWAKKAHTWRIALDPEEIKPSMEALTAERRRRREVLGAAGVVNWEEYAAKHDDVPLLVVYVSELLLLENATSKGDLTSWLNAELTAAAAFGIRYIISTQSASNFSTQWRSQISLFIAGYQPAQSQDAPNTGLTTKELRDIGAIPPSELPGQPTKGVFTAVQGREAVTLRAGYIDPTQRQRLLAAMPDKPLHAVAAPAAATPARVPQQDDMLARLLAKEPLPFEAEGVTPLPAGGRGVEERREAAKTLLSLGEGPSSVGQKLAVSGAPDVFAEELEEIPAEERAQIIAAAQTAASRSQLCQSLYGTKGGRAWKKVKLVCDALGLLTTAQPQEQAA